MLWGYTNFNSKQMYFAKIDIDRIEQALFDSHHQEEVFMILLAEEDMFFATALVDLFNLHGAVFLGGVFPYIIVEGELKEQGVVIRRYSGKGECFVIQDSLTDQEDVAPLVEYVRENAPDTALMFTDGMSPYISDVVSSLYRYLGTSVRYFGAGAGTSDLVQKPVVFCRSGVLENCAAILFIKMEVHMTVRHGWVKLKGPLMVTGAEKNVLKTLNWQPAFEVYRQELGKAAAGMTAATFRKYARGHPLGFYREDSGEIIRSPFAARKDGALLCVGNVDDNTMVHIMKGNIPELKAAAVESAQESLKAAGSATDLVVFTCLARKHYLDAGMSEELSSIRELFLRYPHSKNISGAITLGAFASLPSGYLEFFTKSVLTGAIE